LCDLETGVTNRQQGILLLWLKVLAIWERKSKFSPFVAPLDVVFTSR